MTTILQKEVACPCGREFTAYVLRSYSNFGGDKPTFILRGYARCRGCGHRTEKEGAIEFLSDDPTERSLQLDPLFEPTPEDELPPKARSRSPSASGFRARADRSESVRRWITSRRSPPR